MNAKLPSEMKSYLDWANQSRAEWWRYLIGVVIALGATLGGSTILLLPIMFFIPALWKKTPVLTLINIGLSFLVLMIVLWLVIKLLHHRPLWTVALPKPRVEWWNLGVGIGAKLVVVLVTILIYKLSGISQVSFHAPDPAFFLRFALIATAALLFQTAGEELVFRGYLTQAVRRFTANPLVFLSIPAIMFAVPHIFNIAVFGGKWYAILPFLVDGLVLGWLAYRSRSLWMSIGIHWTNNLMLATIYTLKGAHDVIPSLAPIQMTMPHPKIIVAIGVSLSILLVVCLTWVIDHREKNLVDQA